MAWLEERAALPATPLQRERAAELLVLLAERGCFRPLAYVRWLLARGLLPGAPDGAGPTCGRSSWHRCPRGFAVASNQCEAMHVLREIKAGYPRAQAL